MQPSKPTLSAFSEIRIFFSKRAQSLNHSKIKMHCYFCIMFSMVKGCDHTLGETVSSLHGLDYRYVGAADQMRRWFKKYFTLKKGFLKTHWHSPSQKSLDLQPTGDVLIMDLLSQTSSVYSILTNCLYCSSFFESPFMT